jgi:hypothetical protein
VGWYGGWYWPGYAYYGYGPSDQTYSYEDDGYGSPEAARPSHGPATVVTGVNPSGADVVLDGEAVGFASDYNGRWDKLSVAAGRHTIAFKAKGYKTVIVEFDAHPGATYAFNDVLEAGEGEAHRSLVDPPIAPQANSPQANAPPAALRPPVAAGEPSATGRLRVHVEPEDAAVYLDGAYLGLGAELARVHAALAVPTGTHRLEAVRPGYVSAVRTIEVGETNLAIGELTLEPAR